MNSDQRQHTPLNIRDPKVIEISNQFNLHPKIVAYLRAAIGSGRYNRETLIDHIEIENKGRVEAIERHKADLELPIWERKNRIKYTRINIEFRNDVVALLMDLSEADLNTICN